MPAPNWKMYAQCTKQSCPVCVVLNVLIERFLFCLMWTDVSLWLKVLILEMDFSMGMLHKYKHDYVYKYINWQIFQKLVLLLRMSSDLIVNWPLPPDRISAPPREATLWNVTCTLHFFSHSQDTAASMAHSIANRALDSYFKQRIEHSVLLPLT